MSREHRLSGDTITDSYADFVAQVERRLRQALSASLGSELGAEAAAEALAYGWEHWPRLRTMESPAGYLYTVGRTQGLRMARRRKVVLMPVDEARVPWVEPGLPAALARLTERQRVVVMLLHSFEWTMAEVADLLGISKSAVQTYSERGLARLRRRMGVS